MLERDGYIAGVPCWIDTSQPDPEAPTRFYGALFGWKFENVMPAGSPQPYFVARIGGADVGAVSAIAEGAPPTAVWNTYVWVDSADATSDKVRAAGGQVLTEPFDVGPAGRMAVVADPEGAVFCLWQAAEHKGAQIVNEPGSLNFNTLNTRDPDGAKAFYGEVFGWKVLDLGGGGGMMWQLPGYAEFLEQRDPGLRERMAEGGAPEGFEDVVAAMVPLAGDQPGAPAHWSVTFAVDDADATAATAYELGGRVVVPPIDAPWVRMTVLADPAGATFVASKFVPENSDLAAPAESTAAAT
jgi:predicted enzyme related to lactoylglutathione lyase